MNGESLVFQPFASSVQGVAHFFGTRHEPRDLAPSIKIGQVTTGPPSYPLVGGLKQVHGTDVVVLDRPFSPGDPLPESGDALVTTQPGLLLVVRTADCVPVLIGERKGQVVAAIHAGWRGTVAGIVSKTITLLKNQFKIPPQDLHLAIGPSIGPCCYEVDQPVIQPLKKSLPGWRSVLEPSSSEKGRLDLKKLIAHQAMVNGVMNTAITSSDLCTQCQSEWFYSYRREGRVNGTMISGIMLTRGISFP